MLSRIAPVIASLVLATAAAAQTSQNPIADALRAAEERGARNLIGSAQEMPADKYGFHPTPAQMTFGQLVLHVATSNEFLCSRIGNVKASDEAKLEATSPKDQLVARLQRSFDYCKSALANVDDSKLGESVPFFGGRSITRGAAMMDLASDWADHYSAAASYLRLNGLLPPTARRATSR